MELECPVKQYHWGKHGTNSLVAELKRNVNSDFVVNNGETYAELWMGTHPSGPAYVKKHGTSLENWILMNPSSLGKAVKNTFGVTLPFLFKVLSVEMPLSIQVHPSKETAAKLHAKYPELYQDRNHKPEIAIALTEFEALCGFRPIDEIKNFLTIIPELCELIGPDLSQNLLDCNEINQQYNLKKCFTALMTAPEDSVRKQLQALIKRISDMGDDEENKSKVLHDLLNRIHGFFPGDVGCFCIYFFNHLILKPGEAIFLSANDPHAYLSGDCIECMATSDNVVRAGLTPKFRDVNTLCEIINYSCSSAKSKILAPEKENEFSHVYRPPVSEFAVSKININKSDDFKLTRSTPSISIVINGNGRVGDLEVFKGKVIYNGANDSLFVRVPPKKSLLMYQAFVNV